MPGPKANDNSHQQTRQYIGKIVVLSVNCGQRQCDNQGQKKKPGNPGSEVPDINEDNYRHSNM